MRILLIEDDAEAVEVLVRGLAEAGHEVTVAKDAGHGMTLAGLGGFDVIVLDRMLPDGDGLEVLEQLRDRADATPVVFVSALNAVVQRVRALRAGGDDYVTKPYAFDELLARLEAVVRRREALTGSVLRVGDLELDLIARTARRGGVDIPLQPREFRLLEFLARRAGQTVTRSMLMEGVWGQHVEADSRVIDVQLSRLRNKIDRNFDRPLIHTVRRIGICLNAVDPSP